MNCLRCGAETPEKQVFCDHCLSDMARYPVNPHTHVHLPKRARDEEILKKSAKRKRTLSAEEQISALRRKVKGLWLTVAILVLVLCVVGSFLTAALYQENTAQDVGRNYTIDTSMN